MTQKLDGKVAVVTGTSSGIGEAMSGDKQLFAKRCATLRERVYALTLAEKANLWTG